MPYLDITTNGAGTIRHSQSPQGCPPTAPEVFQVGLLARDHHHVGVGVLGESTAGRVLARIVGDDVGVHRVLQSSAGDFVGVKLARCGGGGLGSILRGKLYNI